MAKWTGEQVKREKYVRLYREGRFPVDGKGEAEGANVNLCFAYVQLVTAAVALNLPIPEIEPRQEGGNTALAEALEQWFTYSLEETETELTTRVLVFGSILQGLGWTKESYDPRTGLDVSDPLTCQEVHVDPLAKWSLRQARYVLQEVVKPIDEAREFFNTRDLEPNYRLTDARTGSIEAERVLLAQNEAGTKDLFKFYEIWAKDKDKRLLSYRDHQAKRWIARGDWPFTLDGNDWPFTPLILQTDYRSLDGFSEQETVDKLQAEVSELCEFDRRHVRKGSATKVLYDLDRVDEAEAEKVKSPQDLQMVGVKSKGLPLESAFSVLRLTSGTDDAKAIYERAKQLHDEVLGVDEMLNAGASDRAGISATEASIRENYGRMRSSLKTSAIDRHQQTALRHRAQIVRQLVDPALIARATTPEAAMTLSMYKGDAQDLVREFSIAIRAGSTGERYRAKREQEAERTLQLLLNANQFHMQTFGRPRYDIDEAVLELMKARNVRQPQRYLLTPEKMAELMPPPPPQPMGAPVDQGGQPLPAGPEAVPQGMPPQGVAA